MQFPTHYPFGCPPEDSEPALGEAYRVVENNPPTPLDFRSPHEIKPGYNYGRLECHAVGVSLYRDIDDIYRMQKRIPAKRNLQISIGTLSPEMGRTKPTVFKRKEKSHITWWVPIGVFPWLHFKVIENAKAN